MDDNTRDIKRIEEQIRRINNEPDEIDDPIINNDIPDEDNTSNTIRLDRIEDIKKEVPEDEPTKKINVVTKKKEEIKQPIKQEKNDSKEIYVIFSIIITFFLLIFMLMLCFLFI